MIKTIEVKAISQESISFIFSKGFLNLNKVFRGEYSNGQVSDISKISVH